MPPTLAHQSLAALVDPAGWLHVSAEADQVPPAPAHIFCMSTRALPAQPASGSTSPRASAIPPIIRLLVIGFSSLRDTASLESSRPKIGTIPATVGSRRSAREGSL